jgi:hypothetical protein
MNATDVINELVKRGGVADKEWHGEKLEMKTQEQRAEESWAQSENDQDAEDQQEQETNNDVEPDRFEIEIEDSKSKKQNSLNGKDSKVPSDALQRQRPTASAVF